MKEGLLSAKKIILARGEAGAWASLSQIAPKDTALLACCRPEQTADQHRLASRRWTSEPPRFFDSTPSLRTSGALKKVSTFFLYRSANMMYKGAVIPLLRVSAVEALITRLSLTVWPLEALWSDLLPTKQTLHQVDHLHAIKSIRSGGKHFMFSQLLLIICQALCKGCDKHV